MPGSDLPRVLQGGREFVNVGADEPAEDEPENGVEESVRNERTRGRHGRRRGRWARGIFGKIGQTLPTYIRVIEK